MPGEGELAAVLTALAGVRTGHAVVGLSVGQLTRAALAAGCGLDPLDDAAPGSVAVVVVGPHGDLVHGRRLLAPGGRLVALALDDQRARSAAVTVGLVVEHVEAVAGQVAWSARDPLSAGQG